MATQEMNRTYTMPVLAALVTLVMLALPGIADAAAEGGKTEFLKFQWDLGLWTLVVFLLLLALMRAFAWKPIMEGLEKREQTIRQARDDAIKAKEEAAQIRDQLKAELNAAHQKARDIVEEARKDGQALVESIRTKAQAEIQSERDRLRREVEMAKDQALGEIWSQSVQLASLISTKVVRRELSSEDHGRLLDESLAELKTQLGGQPTHNA